VTISILSTTPASDAQASENIIFPFKHMPAGDDVQSDLNQLIALSKGK